MHDSFLGPLAVIGTIAGSLYGAASLCGIGMCDFVPLSLASVAPSALAAGVTIFMVWFLDLHWRLLFGCFAVPMLLPTVVAATGLPGQAFRFGIAISLIAFTGLACSKLSPDSSTS